MPSAPTGAGAKPAPPIAKPVGTRVEFVPVQKEVDVIDFTYTVFLLVASLSGLLLTVFTVGVIGVILYDRHREVEPVERAELRRAA
jgi:hypothetical protein